MDLINCKNVNVHPYILRNLFVNNLIANFKKAEFNGSLPIIQLLKEFNESDIINAIKSIYYNGEFISVPETGGDSLIIRYLEFGGENVKASNIVSQSVEELKRSLGVNVYGNGVDRTKQIE